MPVSREGLSAQVTEILDINFDAKVTTLDETVTGELLSRFFVIDRSNSYLREAPPSSGHVTLDFTTVVGRQNARDLAHDILLMAEQSENAVLTQEAEDTERLANILLATTDISAADAHEQAKALIDAGIEFKLPKGKPETSNDPTPPAPEPQPEPEPAWEPAVVTPDTEDLAETPDSPATPGKGTGKGNGAS
jgi:hypothetical protein